jgi:hypothetical protein
MMHRYPPGDSAAGGRGAVWFASGLNFLIGLWLIASPWIYGFTGNGAATWNRVIVGIIIAVFAGIRLVSALTTPWLSWVNAALGVWVFFSPWIFGYAGNGGALWNSIVLGVVVVILGVWSALAGGSSRGLHMPTRRPI